MIELLVVIFIIALLASIVAVQVNKARLKSRNVARVASVKAIATAFSMYINLDGSSLPVNHGPIPPDLMWSCVSNECYGGWYPYVHKPVVDDAISPYLAGFPDDPKGGTRNAGGYMYAYDWAGAVSPYDGFLFKPGAYLNYLLELTTVSSGICGPGRVYYVSSDGNWIQCMLKLD